MRESIKHTRKIKLRKVAVKRYVGDIILLYRLTEERTVCLRGGYGDEFYSLSVTKIDCGGERREIKHLRDISRDRAEAERIFKIVSRALVTPCTVAEIVSDLIGV